MKPLNKQGKKVNERTMTSFFGNTFSTECKTRSLTSTNTISPQRNYGENLENKYMAEHASSKKFLISNFSSYKMVKNRPVINQFHELQRMHANMKLHKIEMDEVFVISCIIDKLPPSWRDVRHTLKHKREEITLSDLGQHIVVEFSIRI